MFSEKKVKNTMEPTSSQNRINEGTQLTGDIISNGFFRIDGSIEGNISKPSKVVLGKTGSIKGKLTCNDADIEGRFEGSLNVSGTLTLKATAHIEGDVIVGKLSVEPGATFNATCAMQGTTKTKTAEETTANNPYDRQHRFKKTSTSETSQA
ncbi:MAG: polymer-forming cytoskeletal protein [Flavobacteriaceae bacterium]